MSNKRVLLAMLAIVIVWSCPPAVSAGPALPERQSEWLATAGRSKDWAQATAKCRRLLAKLKPDAPLVRKHLPNVRDKVRLLRRTPSFDWKGQTAIDFLENMLADLTAGAEPNRRYAGKGVAVPYWSATMARVEAIWVHVPPAYDPARTYQLFIYYKCGGGLHYKDGKARGGYRPSVEVANQTDTFHAWSSLSTQVKGRKGAVRELTEAVPALASEFAIDPDRVFLSGYSDGGFTSLWLASRYPHLVAGIAPECANWQYGNVSDVGLCNVPMLVVDGWFDGGYNRGQFVRWHTLHTMGCDVAGLWGQHGHTYKPYEDLAELRRILAWAKARRRNLWPRRVRYATWNLSWHRAFWVSIERMAEPSLAARIDAEVKPANRVEVRAWNVAAYTLRLGRKLVDPSKPVTIVTNGKASYSGPLKAELSVEVVKLPAGRFVKGAAMPGGITTQIERSTYALPRGGGLKVADRKWLWVRPTGGDERTRKLLAGWVPSWAKPDTDVTDGDLAACNLFVFGGPAINRLTARIAGDLPVTFGRGTFSVGKRTYGQPTNCVKLLHPNPLNPRKYVIVYAFNDAAAFAENKFFGTREESSWGFRSGDCVVMGLRRPARQWGVAAGRSEFEQDHYILDSNWRPPDETPVGELAATFGYAQILRLRAEAAREATGADVGLMPAYTPGWGRWRSSLPAGAVSLHDIATVDMLPQYITLADVRGDALAGLVARAAAATVAADPRDPSHDAKARPALSEIDPKRTYRVAMGYYGLPAYGAEPRKMPGVFSFRSPAEFLAGGNTSLGVRNLRQVPIELNEAVAAYIRRRRKVSPRAVCFDLAEYVMDPRANEFGACDWLHLGADVKWRRPRGARPVEDRYTLSLGLRAAGDPPLGPPRANAKTFRRLDLTGARGVDVDFAAMDKKLAVAVAARAVRFAVAADKAGTSFRLTPPDAAGAAAARGVLVNIRLTNRGKRDVVGLAALGPSAMQRREGGTWPDKSLRRPIRSCYVGYRRTIGPRGKPPIHQHAALFLFDAPGCKLDTLAARSAGYNFGLVGIRRPVRVKAGGAASVPLVFVAAEKPADGPAADLAAVLDAVKDALRKKLSAQADAAR